MPRHKLRTEVQPLVHFSTKMWSGKRRWRGEAYCLRDDVDAVLLRLDILEKSGGDSELDAWKAEREEEVAARRLSTVLKTFLDHLESQDQFEKYGLKSERRNAIERRLIELGWDQKDLQLYYVGTREWDQLVEQPKPLTERIWTNIRPKLIPLLERNRELRLETEKEQRKHARKLKLSQLLSHIKDADPPLIDAQIKNIEPPSWIPSSPTIKVSHQRVFPLAVDLLEYPIMKSLDEADVSASEMEARFEEHREEINAHISEWRVQIEGHMAELLRKGRESDGLREAAPAPILPVVELEPNPFDKVSDDLKILLRADSLFESTSSPFMTPFNYSALTSVRGSSMYAHLREHPLDLAGYRRDARAQGFAKALLAGMGKPDASFLELKSVEPRLMCGRCHNGVFYNWEEMVGHYIDEKRAWEKIQTRILAAEKLGITFKNVHALDAKNETPLTETVNSDSFRSHYASWTLPNYKCLLCTKVGGLPDIQCPKTRIIKHVSQVHSVANPQKVEHYARPATSRRKAISIVLKLVDLGVVLYFYVVSPTFQLSWILDGLV
ncbi:hypothetical protein BDV93DRAFT_510727 [Ceratobasidium sp. AG-I]|nr:hypothetical protein BDV93DRAFT_510727 [Ceratobasidium sp. AG-I]